MVFFKITIVIFLLKYVIGLHGNDLENITPPHCTQVAKDTDYVSKFKFDYPVSYLIPGQREAYQQMYCINPATVNKAVATVCDWVSPPQAHFTLGDDYLHVVRQDPTGRYLGNAVITTYQYCNHNISSDLLDAKAPIVTQFL
ncbi:uncharacterized protein LOC101737421 [Bombyx mori]|uniref:Uncharacterized protein n=1 Tax=Bombyx mori TaxID=7091 RepID=A0A8R1WFY7_BOMMO|nr:uncharacterized protein LOC101745073 [Bombyx mori]XP_004934281.1 uncharacterized protein LOC101737421 [Bombyx mori]